MTWSPPLPGTPVEFYTIEKRKRSGEYARMFTFRGPHAFTRAQEKMSTMPGGYRMVQCLVITEN